MKERCNEHPIIFSGPMVCAILQGIKTQTRRTSRLDLINKAPDDWKLLGFVEGRNRWWFSNNKLSGTDGSIEIRCPYGIDGDSLWVKESWGLGGARLIDPCLNYQADMAQLPVNRIGDEWVVYGNGRTVTGEQLMRIGNGWRNPMFMPRWASRISLPKITVQPVRLHSLTRDQALAEGIQVLPLQSPDDPSAWYQSATGQNQARTPVDSYAKLYNSLNGAKAWQKNPWVWRLSFPPATQP